MPHMHTITRLTASILVAATGAFAVAQDQPRPAAPAAVGGARGVSEVKRDNYVRLLKPLTIELTDQRLEDVMTFIRDLTGADLDPVWADDRADGLEKDKKITLTVKDKPALHLLERVLDKSVDNAGDATWQFGPDGQIEVGPKTALNKHATLKIYPIHDLLFDIPDFGQVPQLDLNSVLSQGGSAGGSGGGGGGGGNSNLFQDTGNQNQPGGQVPQRDEDNARRIIELITESIDPPQWQDNGGEGASVRFHNGSLLIKAPDYIHRQIVGYSFMK